MHYGQDREDEWIWPHLADIQGGYAVDVGAADGKFLSNTLYFEERGWTCLCIEPNPLYYGQLTRNRKLTMPYGVSDHNTELVPFYIHDLGQGDYTQATGFDPALVDKAMAENIAGNSLVYPVRVPVKTLDYCLAEAGFPRCDYVSIDTEGHEHHVLRGFSIYRWQPRIVVIESWVDDQPYAAYFEQHGYQRIMRAGYNDIYQRQRA